MNEDALIGVYGIFQRALRIEGKIGYYGNPITERNDDESDSDTISLYKWLSAYLAAISEVKLNERKETFNDIVRGLEKEYFLNDFLFGIFMFENLVGNSGTVPQKIVLIPKINRLIKHMKKGIIAR